MARRAVLKTRSFALVTSACIACELYTQKAIAQQVEQVEVENVFRQREGYVSVQWESTTETPVAIGFSDDRPVVPQSGVRFGQSSVPVLCSTPCSMYLRPGVLRFVGEADRPHIWATDLTVAPGGALFRIRPHRVGLSALGGAMFILGLGGSALGPGVIVVNLVVGTAETRGLAILGGSISAAIGVGLLVGGWFVIQAAAPAVTAHSFTPVLPARRSSVSSLRWVPTISLAGAMTSGLSITGEF